VQALPGVGFLAMSVFLGIVLTSRILGLRGVPLWSFGALGGILLSAWMAFLGGWAAHSLGSARPVEFGAVGTLFCLAALCWWVIARPRRDSRQSLALTRWDTAFLGLSVAVAAGLMFSTFRYDTAEHIFRIDRLVWSDFASHLPLVRSFSLGENIPPKAPLFGGEPLRYHFLFYFAVGALERLGLPVDWAMNLLSTLGFAGLLAGIAFLVRTLFPERHGRSIAGLTLLLFLTSGSYALVTGFRCPSDWDVHSWWQATGGRTAFLSGGPYYNWDNVVTGLFWTLTIFTNQRHFAFGIAVGLFVFTIVLKMLVLDDAHERSGVHAVLLLALLQGALPLLHGLSYTAFMMVSALLVPVSRHKAHLLVFLALAAALAVPQLAFLRPVNPEAGPALLLGYGLSAHATVGTFLLFWLKNLGVKLLLIPAFLVLLPRAPRLVMLASLSLFVVPNLVRFGPDVWTNHKFFNIWLIFLNVGTAYLIWRFFACRWVGKGLGVALLVATSATGLLDIAPIFNDRPHEVADWQRTWVGRFVAEQTSPNEILATSYTVYHPAGLAGRAVLCGWPYFNWSAGYPVDPRLELTRRIFETRNRAERCALMRNLGVRYIVAGQQRQWSEPYKPDLEYLVRTLDVAAADPAFVVFDAGRACRIP
jgi:hypothetical protein